MTKQIEGRLVEYDPAVCTQGNATAPFLVEINPASIRIVLGGEGEDGPDIFIERRPGGWAALMHGSGYEDPACAVHFRDEGGVILERMEPFLADLSPGQSHPDIHPHLKENP